KPNAVPEMFKHLANGSKPIDDGRFQEESMTIKLDPLVCFVEKEEMFTLSPLKQKVTVTRRDWRIIIKIITLYFNKVIKVDDSFQVSDDVFTNFYLRIFNMNFNGAISDETKQQMFEHSSQFEQLLYSPLIVYKHYGYPFEDETTKKLFTNLEKYTSKPLPDFTTSDVQGFFNVFEKLFIKMTPFGILSKMLTSFVYSSIFKDADDIKLPNRFNEEDIIKNIIWSNYKHFLICDGEYISARFYTHILFPRWHEDTKLLPNKSYPLTEVKRAVVKHLADKYEKDLKGVTKRRLMLPSDNEESLENLVSQLFKDCNIPLKVNMTQDFELGLAKIGLTDLTATLPFIIFPHALIFQRSRMFSAINIYANTLSHCLSKLTSKQNNFNLTVEDAEKITKLKKELTLTIKRVSKQIINMPLLTAQNDISFLSKDNLNVLLDLVYRVYNSGSLTELFQAPIQTVKKITTQKR
ncbi:MAG: hypothetical protein ACRYGG_14445, partial [Janthinobacterium lividum]